MEKGIVLQLNQLKILLLKYALTVLFQICSINLLENIFKMFIMV